LVVVIAAAMALLGACAQQVAAAGHVVPATVVADSGLPHPAAPPVNSGPEDAVTGGCSVTLDNGNQSFDGSLNSRSVNGALQFTCNGGPFVSMDEVSTGGVRFSIGGGASILINAEATEQVGPYWITVWEAAPPTAKFDITPVG
jgi:hypothetical protein